MDSASSGLLASGFVRISGVPTVSQTIGFGFCLNIGLERWALRARKNEVTFADVAGSDSFGGEGDASESTRFKGAAPGVLTAEKERGICAFCENGVEDGGEGVKWLCEVGV